MFDSLPGGADGMRAKKNQIFSTRNYDEFLEKPQQFSAVSRLTWTAAQNCL